MSESIIQLGKWWKQRGHTNEWETLGNSSNNMAKTCWLFYDGKQCNTNSHRSWQSVLMMEINSMVMTIRYNYNNTMQWGN